MSGETVSATRARFLARLLAELNFCSSAVAASLPPPTMFFLSFCCLETDSKLCLLLCICAGEDVGDRKEDEDEGVELEQGKEEDNAAGGLLMS